MTARVLVIDDEVIPGTQTPDQGGYMWYYVKQLEEEGFDVTCCQTFVYAKSAIEDSSEPFDICVLDVMMPAEGSTFSTDETENGLTTGTQVAKALEAVTPATKILVLTNQGHPPTHEALMGIKSVRDVCLKEAFTPKLFVAKMHEVLQAP